MVYIPNIPQPGDNPSNSQPDLLGNFSTMNSAFSVNHIPLTTGGSAQGYHTQIFLNNVLGSDPDLTAPQSSLYTKSVAGSPELFFQNGSLGSDVVQLTDLPVVTTHPGSDFNYGIVTPWGFTINMGLNASGTATFAVPFVAGTFYGAFLTPFGGFVNFSILSLTITQLRYQQTGADTFYYMVFGV